MRDFIDRLGQLVDRLSHGPRRVRDLSADEAGTVASALYKRAGRNLLSARLIFRALELNSWQPNALLSLADFLRAGTRDENPSDTYMLSMVAVERARTAEGVPQPLKEEIDAAHLRLLWEMKYAVYRKDPLALPTDFRDASQFQIDELGFKTMFSTQVQRMGTHTTAFRIVHAWIGQRGELLRPRPSLLPGMKVKNAQLQRSPAYWKWIRTPLNSIPSLKGML